MAHLFYGGDQSVLTLASNHFFGRCPSVNTAICDPHISNNHAIIEWQDNRWYLKDISRNGTWLNQVRMKPNTRYLLSVNDEISFPGVEPHSFRVLSLLPPERSLTLIPIASTELTPEIVIDYALLPNEQEAEVAIYFEPKTERWIANYCTEAAEQCLQLRDGDQICFRGLEWRVSIVETQAKTVAVSPDLVTCADLNFRFELSLDEENTHLLIDTQDKQFDLKIFAHHYLTANLARYRAADAARGIGSDDQGWVDVERLGKDLGLNNTHLNIQIHRARKQFQNTLMTFDTDFLIQRVPGKVRFGGEKMSLLKGGKLECSIDNLRLKSA